MTFLGDAARFHARASDGLAIINGRKTRIAVPEGTPNEIQVFCRPWNLRIVAVDAGDIVGTVQCIRRIGAMRHVELDVPGSGRIEAESATSLKLELGDEVGVIIERARVFP